MRLPTVLIAASLAFTACSSGSTTTLTPNAPQASTFAIVTGAQDQNQALQGLNFYPASLSINVGDTVSWAFPTGEPHTVAIVPAGQPVPPPSDPNVAKPSGSMTTDGTAYSSSGFQLLGGNYSMTFTKVGTYTYRCLIHPGMIGTVLVRAAGTAYPQTQAQLDAMATTGQSTDLTSASASLATFPYPVDGTHLAVGISPAVSGGAPVASSTVLRFLSSPSLSDQSVTIPVGTTLTWTNLSNNEPHTVSIGANGQPFPTIRPPGAPTGNTTFDGSAFSNSGILFPGQSYSLTFTKAGTYTVHCVFHDDTEHMISTVVVV